MSISHRIAGDFYLFYNRKSCISFA